jgi:hypothetical protein
LKTIITILFIYISGLTYLYSSSAQSAIIPFTATSPSSFLPVSSTAGITTFYGNIANNRVWLNWTVEKNQDTDKFEIEKSNDGKNFTMAALVFGTDKPDNDKYQFYEKAKAKKIFYRIKILYKNNTAEYSDIIVVETNNKTASTN